MHRLALAALLVGCGSTCPTPEAPKPCPACVASSETPQTSDEALDAAQYRLPSSALDDAWITLYPETWRFQEPEGLPRNVVRHVIHGALARVGQCVDRVFLAAKKGSSSKFTFEGRTTLSAKVDETGAATWKVSGGTLGDPAFAECVRARTASLRFPKPAPQPEGALPEVAVDVRVIATNVGGA